MRGTTTALRSSGAQRQRPAIAPARSRMPVRKVVALWAPWGSGGWQGPTAWLTAKRKSSKRASSTTVVVEPQHQQQQQQPPAVAAEQWTDRWTELRDRVAAPPLALPPISAEQQVTLVRHGQSTWNAELRVQGSSDESVLTDKGVKQAQATASLLSSTEFTGLWFSPLARASQTAQVVWNGRVGPQHCDPVLREIDLYSFQGLLKQEVKERYGAEYSKWHHHPDEFELDGHLPVHETWYRGSLAWQKILPSGEQPQGQGQGQAAGGHTLVVAHNNINQALIAVALQLPVSFFRRLVQCNAAMSQLLFTPSEMPGQPPEAKLLCLNQSSASPFKKSDKVAGRVVLVVASADEREQQACAQLISDTPVAHVLMLSEPGAQGVAAGASSSGAATASAIASRCRSEEGAEPDVMSLMHQAGNEAWQSAVRLAAEQGGCTVVVVLSSAQAAAGLTCSALGLGQLARPKFHFEPAGVSVFEFAAQPGTMPPSARCINSRAHVLGGAMEAGAGAAPAAATVPGSGSDTDSPQGPQELQ